MTSRLVALMTSILVLCLAAFALIMSHYQRRVMDEVSRIVAEMGRATVRTLNVSMLGTHPRGESPEAMVSRWVGSVTARSGKPGSDAVAGEVESSTSAGPGKPNHTVIWFFSDGEAPRRVELSEDAAGEEQRVALRHIVEELNLASAPGSTAATQHFRFRTEDVRTVAGPGGLMLRIPAPIGGDPKQPGHEAPEEPVIARSPVTPAGGAVELKVPLGELQALARGTRQKSLLLFVSVLVVGSGLAAGFAHRFTLPARRLDAGIRRLSAGDIGVEVEVRGDDEMARLGKAFNEMAAELAKSREREREMARREKLAALGRLAAGVAHDVRNPLHSIGLTVQHLQETCRPERDDARREFDHATTLIRGEIKRLDQLIANFLGFATARAGERSALSVRELFSEVARLVEREAARRQARLEVAVAPDVPAIAVDAAAMRSAVLNLVLNSLEAVSEGGRVTLSARREGEGVVAEVSDDGRGIPEEDRERVFEYGFTTRGDGHGLGLAMVHQVVVEDHGGSVSLESQAGVGTTVTMRLPAASGVEPMPRGSAA